jgi:hypothetical protein
VSISNLDGIGQPENSQQGMAPILQYESWLGFEQQEVPPLR